MTHKWILLDFCSFLFPGWSVESELLFKRTHSFDYSILCVLKLFHSVNLLVEFSLQLFSFIEHASHLSLHFRDSIPTILIIFYLGRH